MQAQVKNEGEITIVTIKGFLDIEKTQPFRDLCEKHFLSKKIVFNMESANFVGSTGLQPFLEAVKKITEENSHGLKLVCVKSEFKRIFLNLENQNLQIHETEASAIQSFTSSSAQEA